MSEEQGIRAFIWNYWKGLTKSILLYVWNRLSVEEITDIAKYYLPELAKEKPQIIKQLLHHFFHEDQGKK